MGKEEPNFPVNTLRMQKHGSHQVPNTLQSHKFATIVTSDDSIDRRSQAAVSRKSSKPQMKKVDYTDISLAMVNRQRATASG